MKRHKILVLIALICSFGAAQAMEPATQGMGSLEFKNNFKVIARAFVTSGEAILIESLVGKKVPENARRGRIYAHYRGMQKVQYAFATTEGLEIDLVKESIESAAQQALYVPVDAAVSKAADKISQLEPIQRIIASEPIQYISKNVSAENKKFFKDQAIVAASAVLINGAYQVSEKGQALMSIHNNRDKKFYHVDPRFGSSQECSPSQFDKDVYRYRVASLYGERGTVGAIADRFIINSLDHFVVKKYITEKISNFVAEVIYCNVVSAVVNVAKAYGK